MCDLIQSLKNYTREGNEILGFDEREPEEFLEIFLTKYKKVAVQAANPKAKPQYQPLVVKNGEEIYIWTVSSEGNYWIDSKGNRVDIDPMDYTVLEVKLPNNQIIQAEKG